MVVLNIIAIDILTSSIVFSYVLFIQWTKLQFFMRYNLVYS